MTIAKEIKKYLLSLLILIFGGYLLLVLVYCLPTQVMSSNVAQAVETFRYEPTYRRLNIGEGDSSVQDNFTDALMLLTAENYRDENVFVEALKGDHVTSGGGKNCSPPKRWWPCTQGRSRSMKRPPTPDTGTDTWSS